MREVYTAAETQRRRVIGPRMTRMTRIRVRRRRATPGATTG